MVKILRPLLLFAWADPALAAGGVVGEDLLWLAMILMAARLFAPLAQGVGFPAVLAACRTQGGQWEVGTADVAHCEEFQVVGSRRGCFLLNS